MLNTNKTPSGLIKNLNYPAQEVIPDALIHALTTHVGDLEGDQPTITMPLIVDDTTNVAFVDEGTTIPTSDTALTQVTFNTRKIGIAEPITRESRMNNPTVGDLLATGMSRAVQAKADTALLTSTDTALTGLLNATNMIDGGTITATNLDAVSDLITTIEANGGAPTHITMDPKTWGWIRKLKTATGSEQLLIGNPAEQLTKQLFGIPVVVTSRMTTGTILVTDKANVLSASGQVRLDISEEAHYLQDALTYRVLWRMGWTVARPTRHGKLTLTLPE